MADDEQRPREPEDWEYEMQALQEASRDTMTQLQQRIVAMRGSWLKASQKLETSEAENRKLRAENERLRTELAERPKNENAKNGRRAASPAKHG